MHWLRDVGPEKKSAVDRGMKTVRGTARPLRIGPDDLVYQPQFLTNSEADALLQLLWRDLPWRQEVIVMFGRQVRPFRQVKRTRTDSDFPPALIGT